MPPEENITLEENITSEENSYLFPMKLSIYGSIVITVALYFIKKAITKYLHRVRNSYIIRKSQIIRNLQQQVNVMGMETIAMKQCMKRIIINNQISLDENSSKILKLPDVTIQYISIPQTISEESKKLEYLLPTDNRWEFPRKDLTLGKYLGEGEFGKVLQGKAKNILREDTTTTVAIKMLKDVHSDEDMINLVSEMEIMKLIKPHVNVLQLLGCCTKDGALLVITEYALHGNLQEFLRKYISPDGEITTNLPIKMLITFALQIASGMEHLASIKCIHCDLAARNVLVSDNHILKIADFGLAKDISNKDYYRKRSDGRVPVKWMAPESLRHNVYTSQSDVWSYGILLWEIFSLGGSPYSSLQDLNNIYQSLFSGYRMEKPYNCPENMYSLMYKCWSFKPKDRPLFSEIVKDLEKVLSNDEFLSVAEVDTLDVLFPVGEKLSSKLNSQICVQIVNIPHPNLENITTLVNLPIGHETEPNQLSDSTEIESDHNSDNSEIESNHLSDSKETESDHLPTHLIT